MAGCPSSAGALSRTQACPSRSADRPHLRADGGAEPYFVEETGQFQNKYLQDAFLLEAGTTPPADPAVELARVELAAAATEITDAADPENPGSNEIHSGELVQYPAG